MRRFLFALSLISALAAPLRSDTIEYQWSATFTHFEAVGADPLALSATPTADGFRLSYGTGSLQLSLAPPGTVDSSIRSLPLGTLTATGVPAGFSFTAHFTLSLRSTDPVSASYIGNISGTISAGPTGITFDGASGAGWAGSASVPYSVANTDGTPVQITAAVNLAAAGGPILQEVGPAFRPVPEPSSLLLGGFGLVMASRVVSRRQPRR